jgi:hypothetical protein
MFTVSLNNFKCSNRWLEKFRKRSEIEFKLLHGETGDFDVFNIDESGLFWKALLNKTMVLKGWFFDLVLMLLSLSIRLI